jgi:hypothetical protein
LPHEGPEGVRQWLRFAGTRRGARQRTVHCGRRLDGSACTCEALDLQCTSSSSRQRQPERRRVLTVLNCRRIPASSARTTIVGGGLRRLVEEPACGPGLVASGPRGAAQRWRSVADHTPPSLGHQRGRSTRRRARREASLRRRREMCRSARLPGAPHPTQQRSISSADELPALRRGTSRIPAPSKLACGALPSGGALEGSAAPSGTP